MVHIPPTAQEAVDLLSGANHEIELVLAFATQTLGPRTIDHRIAEVVPVLVSHPQRIFNFPSTRVLGEHVLTSKVSVGLQFPLDGYPAGQDEHASLNMLTCIHVSTTQREGSSPST